VIFTDDDQMIETLSANRANYSFGVWILERRSRRGGDLFDFKAGWDFQDGQGTPKGNLSVAR